MEEKNHTRELLSSLALALLERQSALTRRLRIGFAVVEGGHYVLDSASPQILTEGWSEDVDAAVICNAETLADALRGDLDPDHPKDGQFWLWAGDTAVWGIIAAALGPAQSALNLRLRKSA